MKKKGILVDFRLKYSTLGKRRKLGIVFKCLYLALSSLNVRQSNDPKPQMSLEHYKIRKNQQRFLLIKLHY